MSHPQEPWATAHYLSPTPPPKQRFSWVMVVAAIIIVSLVLFDYVLAHLHRPKPQGNDLL
jgi:hypothetical protein